MRPTTVKIGSLVSIIGAIVAIVALGIKIKDGNDYDIAILLSLLLIALLFFATAGNFYENGISKSQPMALVLIAFNVAAIIAIYVIKNAFDVEYLILMIICALIPAAIAVSEAEWFHYEKI